MSTNVLFKIVVTLFQTINSRKNQSNSFESLNENMNKIDLISKEMYVPDNFNINFSLNDFYIFSKSNMLNNKSIQMTSKASINVVLFWPPTHIKIS